MKKNILAMASLTIAIVMTLAGCSEDKETSQLPVFDKLTLSKTTVSPGDTIVGTVTFSYSGNYVNGTYSYSTSPSLTSGTFACGSSSSSATFKVIIPTATDDTPDEETYTLTVRPTTMAAYAGNAPYIDPAPMGTLKATFTVIK